MYFCFLIFRVCFVRSSFVAFVVAYVVACFDCFNIVYNCCVFFVCLGIYDDVNMCVCVGVVCVFVLFCVDVLNYAFVFVLIDLNVCVKINV